MQQETPVIPHLWMLASNLLTAILSVAGTLTALWFKRKREPVEIAKLHAETRQININTDVSLMQAVTEAIVKAEHRREEWQLKEDQMRTQILFWRNKAEELDGELIDSRNANGQYEIRAKLQDHQTKRLKSLLDYHNISYSELDKPKT